MSFKGEIEVQGLFAATRTLHLVGKGSDTSGTSGASMDLVARIDPGGTKGTSNLVGTSEVTMSGKAAAFGGRMMGSVADQILKLVAGEFLRRRWRQGRRRLVTVARWRPQLRPPASLIQRLRPLLWRPASVVQQLRPLLRWPALVVRQLATPTAAARRRWFGSWLSLLRRPVTAVHRRLSLLRRPATAVQRQPLLRRPAAAVQRRPRPQRHRRGRPTPRYLSTPGGTTPPIQHPPLPRPPRPTNSTRSPSSGPSCATGFGACSGASRSEPRRAPHGTNARRNRPATAAARVGLHCRSAAGGDADVDGRPGPAAAPRR